MTGAALRTSLFSNTRSQISQDLSTAISVNVLPHRRHCSVVEIARDFHLPDFHGALGDFSVLQQTHSQRRGRRRSDINTILPFSHIDVWLNFKLQQRSTQDPSILLPVRTVQALPPTAELPYRHCNTVLINNTSHTTYESSCTTQSFDNECKFYF